jgi:hypothetical protein
MFDVGCWMLDVGCWMLDVAFRSRGSLQVESDASDASVLG